MKPTVYYKGQACLILWYEGSVVAMISDVIQHPSLGDCDSVRTSLVLDFHEDGTIETRNTIYKSVDNTKYKVQNDLTAEIIRQKINERGA